MKPFIAGLLAAGVFIGGAQAAEPVKAKVETGVLVGQADNGVSVFRRVPFARPPVEDLRWAPPKRADNWSGEREAVKDGPACVQRMSADGRPNGGGASGEISEDCLTLNVFAPTGAKAAPVMVWLHGGANSLGSGKIYNFTPTAGQGVVVVSVNYRLGALGFFAHPALTAAADEAEPLANYGLMDQIAALQWVKRNAAAFGGDPNNVTVFGESAGAMDIYALLAAPAAKGLFHKAILQSNIGWGNSPSLKEAEANGVKFAESFGAPAGASVDQLRALPVEKILAGRAGAAIVADGRLIKEPTLDAFKAGRMIDVPTIIGWNSYEASLRQSTGAAADAFTDGQAGAPNRWIASRLETGAPAYLYHFSYVRESERASAVGAAHASEIPYAQNTLRRPNQPEPTAADQAMATTMNACWVTFAKTGKPSCGGLDWPAYSAASDQLMEFGAASGVRANFRKAQLDQAQASVVGPRETAAR